MSNPTQTSVSQITAQQQAELIRLAAMRSVQTPVHQIPENRQPTAPIRDDGGRIAVFSTGYVENPVSRVLNFQ